MISTEFLIQHKLISTASRNPNKTALIIQNQAYTYANIMRDIGTTCALFSSKNIKRGDRILINAGNSYLTIIAYWSSLFSDAVACIVDSESSSDTLSDIIRKISPALLVGHSTDNTLPCINTLPTSPEKMPKKFINTEEDLAMLMHTSGSTGAPKGVMLSHRNVISALESIISYLRLSSYDVILSVLPLHFDYGLYQMLFTLSLGATLILEKNFMHPTVISSKISKYRVTIFPSVPYVIQLLTIIQQNKHVDFSSVRTVTNTGENFSESHIKDAQKLFPNAAIFSMYGLTECKRCSYVPPEMLHIKKNSIGIPMPNLEMWIQDDAENVLPPYHEGNLVISGPSIMKGYWQDTIETNKKIRYLSSGKKILLTGDSAVMDDDGYFYFKGRKDKQLKFKGTKLFPHLISQKIGNIEGVFRSHLFMHNHQLIVCAEVGTEYSDISSKISSVFPIIQKPDVIYITDKFPALSNGKLNVKALEIESLHSLRAL